MPSDPLARVTKAARARAASEREWRAAIKAAHADGRSLRKIGAAAGVSHPRVLQIVRE